jgi:predicted nucleic acid-binding protein
VSLVVVDTDVASTLLRRRASDTLARQLAGRTIAITFVTYGELTKWTLLRRWAHAGQTEFARWPGAARPPHA